MDIFYAVALDDIIGIVDGGGKVVVQYSYDSWGKLLDITGDTALGNANPFRYRSYYYDNETGFYYLGGRYYDAEVGRFINADTTDLLTATPAGLTDKNLYAYCDNNPVVRKDEGGQFWLTAINVVASIAIDIVSAKITGQDYTLKDLAWSTAMGIFNAKSKLKNIALGLINGGVSVYRSYKSGAGLGEALVNGAISGVGAVINTNNLVKITEKAAKATTKITISKSVSTVTDNTLKFGYSSVSAATSQSMNNHRQYKKTNTKRKPAKSTSRIEKLREQTAARRRLV